MQEFHRRRKVERAGAALLLIAGCVTASGAPTDEEGTGGVATGGASEARATGTTSDATADRDATGGTGSEGADGGAASTGFGGGSATGGSVATDTGRDPAATDTTDATSTPTEGDRSPEGVCRRWNADRADLDEGTWSGNVETCDPGDISPEGRTNALRQYNLYRWLADLPPVETDPERDRLAQACALLMEANDALSHDPPMSWACWTEAGAEGAGRSNISSGPGVESAESYMIDPGNETTIGHRRWILSNSLGPIGLGSTGSGASCMQNLGGEGDAGKLWVAWPPPGVFPIEAYGNRWSTLTETGWTIQSDALELSTAQVTVTSAGDELPVTVTHLQGGYGSREAFRFNPVGWEPAAGETYAVDVKGLDVPLAYEVTMVACE